VSVQTFPVEEKSPTTSLLRPEFCSFHTLGKSVAVKTIDATLCGIGAPLPKLEKRHQLSQQLEWNTYINLSFVRDDGYRFEIQLRNAPEPGIVGDRFTVLCIMVDQTTWIDFGILNHATGKWVVIRPMAKLYNDLWWLSPSNTERIVVAVLFTSTAITYTIIGFIVPPHLSRWPALALLATVAFGIAVQWVSTMRLWFFLCKALMTIEIS
jgi:hypothetical protein